MNNDNGPTLYDLNRVLHRGELVGEDKGVLTAAVGFVFGRQMVCYAGWSGSGKTVCVNSVWDLIPESEKVELQMGSEKSLWTASDQIENSNYVMATEWNKFASQGQDALEMGKSFGEGKEYVRRKSVQEDGEWVVEETCLSPKPIITTLADDNDMNLDDELARRTLTMRADPSSRQTEKVIKEKAEKFSAPWMHDNVSDSLIGRIRNRFREVSTRDELRDVALPGFHKTYADKIPKRFHTSRSVIEHLFKVLTGVSRFYGDRRTTYEDNILATPSDLFESHLLYRDTMINQCLKLDEYGNRILSVFPKVAKDDVYDEEAMMTISDIMEELSHQGYNIPRNKIKEIVIRLCFSGYLEEDTTMPTTHYHRTQLSSGSDLTLDWGDVIDDCLDHAKETLPDDVYSNYEQTVNKTKNVVHPITGDKIFLPDYQQSVDPTEEEAEVVKSETKKTAEEHNTIDSFGIDYDD